MIRRRERCKRRSILTSIALTAIISITYAQSVRAVYSNPDEPYCDQVPSDYSGSCWDRQDIDEETGLAPCRDGSFEEDYHDCK
jgi:hypothetical protein